jgi:hypothetical protein
MSAGPALIFSAGRQRSHSVLEAIKHKGREIIITVPDFPIFIQKKSYFLPYMIQKFSFFFKGSAREDLTTYVQSVSPLWSNMLSK